MTAARAITGTSLLRDGYGTGPGPGKHLVYEGASDVPRRKSTHVDDPAAVGRRLRDARERAGLSQRQLSFEGCSPAYISRIEAGERIPSLQLLREMGRRLGVSEDWLATGLDRDLLAEDRTLLDAEIALRFNEIETAEELYSRALDNATTNVERARSLAGLGQIAFEQGDPRRAVQRLEHALSLSGAEAADQPALADTLGRAYATLDDIEPAIRLFRQSLERANQRRNSPEAVRFGVLARQRVHRQGRVRRGSQRPRGNGREGRECARPALPGADLLVALAALRASERPGTRRPLCAEGARAARADGAHDLCGARPPAARPRRARPRERRGGALAARPRASARGGRRKPRRAGSLPARTRPGAGAARPQRGGNTSRAGERRAARGCEPGRRRTRACDRRRDLRGAGRPASGHRHLRARGGAAVREPEPLRSSRSTPSSPTCSRPKGARTRRSRSSRRPSRSRPERAPHSPARPPSATPRR